MPVDLLFVGLLDTSHPVDLVFGEDPGAGSDDADAIISVTLAPPTALLRGNTGLLYQATINVTLAPPTASLRGIYDNAVTRGPSRDTGMRWQKASARPVERSTVFERAQRRRVEFETPWQEASPLHYERTTVFEQAGNVANERALRWQQARPTTQGDAGTSWQSAAKRQRRTAVSWQEGEQRKTQAATRYQQMLRTSRPTKKIPWGAGTPRKLDFTTEVQQGTPLEFSWMFPWQEGRHPPPGRSITIPYVPPFDPCYVPPAGNEVHLVFDDPWTGSTNLLFMCDHDDEQPPALVVVPIRRVYMQINETSLWRVDGDVHIPTYSMSMSLDVDSWTWSFNASVPGAALADIEPDSDGTPVELEVRLNGSTFRMLAESLSRDRSHANSRISIRGRGKAAMLDAPYAQIQNYGSAIDRTAQQLMAEVLTTNGVSIGWDVDWGLVDWLVPGGTWSGQGTYINALNQIAAAAGGYLQPHRTDQEIRVLPRYPFAPWEWATEVEPDFELPGAVAQREAIEWIEKVRYNRVFVQGEVNGVRGQVTRTGTDGAIVAQMVVDPLITHADAARQRGISILSDTGRQAKVSIRLPVLDATNVIEPGKFVRFVDGATTRLGIVRSTSVDIKHPDAWQTLVLETHVP